LKEPTNCSHPMPSPASSSILSLCKRLLLRAIQGFTVLHKSIVRSISAGTVVVFNTRFPCVRLDAQINNTQITLNEEAGQALRSTSNQSNKPSQVAQYPQQESSLSTTHGPSNSKAGRPMSSSLAHTPLPSVMDHDVLREPTSHFATHAHH